MEGAYGAASAYNHSSVMSSTPAQLVVLLYERLVADLQGAAIAIRSGDIEGKSKRLQRASDVIFELLGSLDRSEGGEISEKTGRPLYVHDLQARRSQP